MKAEIPPGPSMAAENVYWWWRNVVSELAIGSFECFRVGFPRPTDRQNRGTLFVKDEYAMRYRGVMPQCHRPYGVNSAIKFNVGRPGHSHCVNVTNDFKCNHLMVQRGT